MDTIVALSSGRPPAAIAVVRVSGPAALALSERLAGSLPPPRRAALRPLRDTDGVLLDRALVLVFPGPGSATGEDLVELHCHGGRAVTDGVQAALIAAGARAAEPGEFTRRALFHGRIDLAQAEGLADLLEAETAGQRRAALAASEGRVSRALRGWLDALSVLSAMLEASIDYAEEGDVGAEEAMLAEVGARATALRAEIAAALAAPPVERVRDGVRVVLAGPPNSGKSTLLNLLAGRAAAIVSPVSGTTRDRIEAPVQRDGIAYVLTDTAGLTETNDAVERIGVGLAGEAIATADVLVWLGDEAPPRADALWVHARADLPDRERLPPGRTLAVRQDRAESILALWAELARRAAAMLPIADDLPLKVRQRAVLEAAAAELTLHADPLIAAEQVRRASRAMATLLGLDATEQMLDALFGRFCLGK
jgi:tRNA modification GTPase